MTERGVLALSLLLFSPIAAAEGLEEVKNFFSARAEVIEVANGTAVASGGLPYFRPDFPVALYSGVKVKNPLTGKEELVITSLTGKGVVFKSYPAYSVIRLTENRGVKKGNLVELDYDKICFVGSDRSFARLQDTLPLEKVSTTEGCTWTIKETPTGYAVLLRGNQVFFARKNLPSYAAPTNTSDWSGVNLLVQTAELKEYNQIPTSVDAVSVGKSTYLAVSFEDGVRFYQVVGDDAVEIGRLPTPGGKIVGVQLFTLNGKVYALGNAVTTDGEPVSFVATLVGTNPVVVKDSVPYLLSVLDRESPLTTFVAQEFDGNFGKVYSVNFDGERLKLGGEVKLPRGVRITSAVLSPDGELAAIVDDSLRIYEGSLENGFKLKASVGGEFGRSYTSVSLPVFKGGRVIFFPPRPVPVTLLGTAGYLVAENEPKKISSVIVSGTLKFVGGRLNFVAPTPSGIYLKKPLAGYTFRDAVQGIAVDGNGTPFAAEGYKNPLLFIKKGKLYKLQFRYF